MSDSLIHRGALVVVLLLSSHPVRAADASERAAARDLGYQGVEEFQRGEYADAVQHLDQAYRILQAPSLSLWSARALEKAGRLVEASERYLETTRLSVEEGGDTQVQEKAIEEARSEREALLPRIPQLTVTVSGDHEQLTVYLGTVELNVSLLGAPVPVDPGPVEVRAEAPPGSASRTVVLAEGARETVVLELSPAREVSAPEDDAEDDNDEEPQGPDRSGIVMLLTGGFKAGTWQSIDTTSSLLDEEDLSTSGVVLQAGGAATGGYSFRSGFTVAGRFRGGALIYPEDGDPLGYLGLNANVGKIFSKDKSTPHFGYILGGFGFEAYPKGGSPWLNFNANGGVSLGGLLLGLGIDFSVDTAGEGFANFEVLGGLDVGFGKRF